MKTLSKTLSLLFLFILANGAWARERMVMPIFIDHIAKGNASVSNVKDSRAVFYNPACIYQVPDGIYGLEISYANSKLVNEIFLDSDSVLQRQKDSINNLLNDPIAFLKNMVIFILEYHYIQGLNTTISS